MGVGYGWPGETDLYWILGFKATLYFTSKGKTKKDTKDRWEDRGTDTFITLINLYAKQFKKCNQKNVTLAIDCLIF